MQKTEAMERLQEIQRIAERTTLYTHLPGVPAIVGGLLATGGCFASYLMIGSWDYADLVHSPFSTQIAFCIMWTLVGATAIGQDIVLTVRAGKKQEISPTTRPGRFAALSLSPSVLVAVVLTAKFLMDEQLQYIAPAWMMCYGTGVYTAGLFSVRLPRILGLAFIAVGTSSLLFFPDLGIPLTAASFGLLHIIFGVLIILRVKRKQAE